MQGDRGLPGQDGLPGPRGRPGQPGLKGNPNIHQTNNLWFKTALRLYSKFKKKCSWYYGQVNT